MSSASDPTRLMYTCVVSDFNLPELEACTVRKPDEVLLIVSDGYLTQADLLMQELEKLNPPPRIRRLHHGDTGVSLGGDDALEIQDWVQRVLLPILARSARKQARHWLNLNGGTKAMGVCLTNGYGWDGVDYRASGDRRIQSMRWDLQQRKFLPDRIFELRPDPVSAIQVARLHADFVSQDRQNPIGNSETKLALAQRVWDAEQTREPNLGIILDSLATNWEDQARASQPINLSWDRMLAPAGKAMPGPGDEVISDSTEQRPSRSGIEEWLRQFNSLCAELAAYPIHWDQDRIRIERGKLRNRQFKHWRAWLMGDWLEQLAANWLLAAGIPESALARNLKSGITEDRSGDKREADLLVHHEGRSSLIEIKAGLPKGSDARTIEQQLSSLGDRFGRTNKGLLIAPNLRYQLQISDRRWEDFGLRCRASKVKLLTDRESLVKFIIQRPA